MADFLMPSLGADMESGTLARWLVKPGDHVGKGQILAEVETDKAVIEAESFSAGTVEELLVDEGTKVAVGTPLARLRTEAVAPQPAAPQPVAPEPATPPPPVPAIAVAITAPAVRRPAAEPLVAPVPAMMLPPAVATGRTAPPSSPLARRLAAVAGLDLAGIPGSGPGGAVLRRDVLAAQAAAPPTAAPTAAEQPTAAVTDIEVTGVDARRAAMRAATGALMARSKREIPHFYLSSSIDLGRAMAWLAETNAARPVASRLLPAALLMKAVARACRQHPEMNGFWIDDGFHAAEHVNLAVAISLRQGGLVAPAILDADTLSLDDMTAALLDLVQRARAGRLRSSEVAEPTITVTNLGDQGAAAVFGVIYPPQVALVGFGRIGDVVVARDGMVGVRPGATMTLSVDHRVSDGHRGSLFIATVSRLLEEPEKL